MSYQTTGEDGKTKALVQDRDIRRLLEECLVALSRIKDRLRR